MQILLEEVAPGTWQVNVVPTTREDVAAGLPSPVRLSRILVGVAGDLLSKAEAESVQPPGPTIQIAQPGDVPPPAGG